jgi:xylose isomerase
LLEEVRHHDDSGLAAELRSARHARALDAGPFTAEKAAALKAHAFDRQALGTRGRPYERLDQLLVELLLGVR